MKNPQGREAKKPKKAKVKTPPRVFDDANRKTSSRSPRPSPTSPFELAFAPPGAEDHSRVARNRTPTWRPFSSRPTRVGTTPSGPHSRATLVSGR